MADSDFLTSGYVDVTRVPRTALVRGVDFADLTKRYMGPSLACQSPVLRDHSSWGLVVTWPLKATWDLRTLLKTDPYSVFWFATGDGDEQDRYIANAMRKVWPALLGEDDSLRLKRQGHEFPNPVPSADDEGRFPMGSFPHGGAKLVWFGDLQGYGGLSALDETEDDVAAGNGAGYAYAKADQLVEGNVDLLVQELESARRELNAAIAEAAGIGPQGSGV